MIVHPPWIKGQTIARVAGHHPHSTPLEVSMGGKNSKPAASAPRSVIVIFGPPGAGKGARAVVARTRVSRCAVNARDDARWMSARWRVVGDRKLSTDDAIAIAR